MSEHFVIKNIRRSIKEAQSRKGMIVGLPEIRIAASHAEVLLGEIDRLQTENVTLRVEVERLKEESSHLWVRIESGEAAAYEQGKAEARKQAAQEIADWLRDDIYSIESKYLQNNKYKAILFFVSDELRQRNGLEG